MPGSMFRWETFEIETSIALPRERSGVESSWLLMVNLWAKLFVLLLMFIIHSSNYIYFTIQWFPLMNIDFSCSRSWAALLLLTVVNCAASGHSICGRTGNWSTFSILNMLFLSFEWPFWRSGLIPGWCFFAFVMIFYSICIWYILYNFNFFLFKQTSCSSRYHFLLRGK